MAQAVEQVQPEDENALAETIARLAAEHARGGRPHLRFSVGELILYVGPGARGAGFLWLIRDTSALGRLLEEGVADSAVAAARWSARRLDRYLRERGLSTRDALQMLIVLVGMHCWRRGGRQVKPMHPAS
ncbi:MAG: hypothetical protein AB2A00_07875 [Myxococcota bacterium]